MWYANAMRTSLLASMSAIAVAVVACGERSSDTPGARAPDTIGETRAPSDAAIDASCRALCALHPDYAGSSRPAPAFSLKTTEGRVVTMEELRGRVVLLNVWSSVAATVVASEMPELAKLATMLRERTDVVLVTIAAEDFPEHAAALLRATLGDGPRYMVLVDQGAKVAGALGTKKFPETWLVDRSGVLRARFDGRRAWGDAKVIAMLDATRDGAFCPVTIDGGYISGAGDTACEKAATR